MSAITTTTKWTSTIFRLLTLIFFRAIPGLLPVPIITLFVAYVPLYIQVYFSQPDLQVVDDEIDIDVKETVVPPDEVGEEGGETVIAEEIEVEETVILTEKIPSIREVLFYGAPNAKRPLASGLTFLINFLLVFLTTDVLFRARWYHPATGLSFVRLGYVSDNEARFLIREPDQAQMPVTLEMRIKDAHLTGDRESWKTAGGLRWTSNGTDFTGAITVPISHPKQRTWEWRTSNNHTGEFVSPPKAGAFPDDGKFTFLSTSCILPRFPYNPADHALAIPGLRHLAANLPELQAQFMLFLGDFIYVDVPARFGKSADEYRMQYRQVYASHDWAPVAQNLSWIHVLDDHEISNDWSSNQTGVYNNAVEPWHIYHADVNPPKAIRAGATTVRRQDATWYEFAQGPASFFLMDTRSYRSSNSRPFLDEDKTMLGAHQLEDLIAWLGRSEVRGVRWKVIASSVPFTKNWPVNNKDTWGGFLVERKRILEAMWDAGARGYGVIVLSGDRHEFAATKFPPPPESKWPDTAAAYEFSTSPLSQFASPIGTYKQQDDEDVMLRYISGGISKFGSFTFETINGEPTMAYKLFINGKETWDTLVIAPPAPRIDNPIASFWDKFRLV